MIKDFFKKSSGLILTAYLGIVLSIISLFLPVIIYVNSNNVRNTFNIISLTAKTSDFVTKVFSEYTGDFMYGLSNSQVVLITSIIVVIGVGSIILSFIGLKKLSLQYTNVRSYRLCLAGLIGTAVPAVTILVLLLMSDSYFFGKISCGLYEIITPLSMAISCYTVTRKHKRSLKEQQAAEKARQYIYTPTSF